MTAFAKPAVAALTAHLAANVSGVAQVLSEWPSANINLTYPAISITTKKAIFSPFAPYLLDDGVVDDETNKAVNLYVVGQYDLSLQIDVWARNKEERYTFYDRFFNAFNNSITPMGLRLQLAAYYSQWIAYTITGYRFEDSDRGAQTEEWRAVVDVEAVCDAVMTREDYIITEPVSLELTLPNSI